MLVSRRVFVSYYLYIPLGIMTVDCQPSLLVQAPARGLYRETCIQNSDQTQFRHVAWKISTGNTSLQIHFWFLSENFSSFWIKETFSIHNQRSSSSSSTSSSSSLGIFIHGLLVVYYGIFPVSIRSTTQDQHHHHRHRCAEVFLCEKSSSYPGRHEASLWPLREVYRGDWFAKSDHDFGRFEWQLATQKIVGDVVFFVVNTCWRRLCEKNLAVSWCMIEL